jgi:hypothetical protein
MHFFIQLVCVPWHSFGMTPFTRPLVLSPYEFLSVLLAVGGWALQAQSAANLL